MKRLWLILSLSFVLAVVACRRPLATPIDETPAIAAASPRPTKPLPTATPTPTSTPTPLPTPTPTPTSTPTPLPTATPEGQCDLAALDRAAAGMLLLNTYSFHESMTITLFKESDFGVTILTAEGGVQMERGFIEAGSYTRTFVPLDGPVERTSTLVYDGLKHYTDGDAPPEVEPFPASVTLADVDEHPFLGWLRPELLEFLSAYPCVQQADALDSLPAQRYEFSELDAEAPGFAATELREPVSDTSPVTLHTYVVWVAGAARPLPMRTEHRIEMANEGNPVRIETVTRLKNINEALVLQSPTNLSTWDKISDPVLKQLLIDSNVPIMADAEITHADSDALFYTTSANKEEVDAFYEEALATGGWSNQGTDQTESGLILTYYVRGPLYLALSTEARVDGSDVYLVFGQR